MYAGQPAGTSADEARRQVTADASGETGVGVGLLLSRNSMNKSSAKGAEKTDSGKEAQAQSPGRSEEYVASKTMGKSNFVGKADAIDEAIKRRQAAQA